MTIYSYPTKKEAIDAAIAMYGILPIEMDVICIFKINALVSKVHGVAEGYGFEECS